jgi:hypothetical protein
MGTQVDHRHQRGLIRHELQTNKHLTLQLLWEEYREKNPEGYRYSRFCDLYRGWLRRQEIVLRHEHRARRRHLQHITNTRSGPAFPLLLFSPVFAAVSGSNTARPL